MSEQPPPYIPHPSGGPPPPGFPPAFNSQPSAFPGTPYQTFPQSYSGGGDQSYYQGGPQGYQGGPQGYQGGPQGYQGGPQGYQGGPQGYQPYGEQPKQTVFLVEQARADDGGAEESCLAACAAAMCCCCLMDMMAHAYD